MRIPSVFPALVFAVWACLDGCTLANHVAASSPVKSARPGVSTGPVNVPQTLATVGAATLTGKVKLVSDNGAGLISDNGGGVISNNTGNLIANNSGSLVSNNGSGLVSDNGGGLTSKVKWGLLSATSAPTGGAETLLADAVVALVDVAGAPIKDASGKPITAVTDAQGTYTLTSPLPARNVLLQVALHDGGLLHGGKLSAMLAHPGGAGLNQSVDTATSLGAAYVLSKYVNGDQTIYDKLPAQEAQHLEQALDAARASLKQAPSYQPAALALTTETLRAGNHDVDSELKTIQTLLVGQKNLGTGLAATQVPLFSPSLLGFDAAGNLLVEENDLGRFRTISSTGQVTTYIDTEFGKVKRNINRATGVALAPDGSLYVDYTPGIVRITPDDQSSLFISFQGDSGAGAVGKPAAGLSLSGGPMATGPDGTLYVGDSNPVDAPSDAPARLFAVDAHGLLQAVDTQGGLGAGSIDSMTADAQGNLYMAIRPNGPYAQAPVPGRIIKRSTDGKVTVLSTQPSWFGPSALSLGPDGKLYFFVRDLFAVFLVDVDGTLVNFIGAGASGETSDWLPAGAPVFDKAANMYVSDDSLGVVRKRSTDGQWSIIAGVEGAVASQTGTGIAVNGPAGAAFDQQGRLLIAEQGGAKLKRFDGTALVTVAGHSRGYSGDGGPAVDARFGAVTCVAVDHDKIEVADGSVGVLREIDAAGIIHPVCGLANTAAVSQTPGVPLDPATTPLQLFTGMAIAPDGTIYFAASQARQVFRLSPDRKTLVAIAGKQTDSVTQAITFLPNSGPATGATFAEPYGLSLDGHGDLYVSDVFNMTVSKISDPSGPSPTISVVAGEGLTGGLNGATALGPDALHTMFYAPSATCFDAQGNMYVAELGTVNINRTSGTGIDPTALTATASMPKTYALIHKITPAGKISILAGPGGKFFTDPAAEDALVLPSMLAIAPDGRMAIVDGGANLVHILPAGSY